MQKWFQRPARNRREPADGEVRPANPLAAGPAASLVRDRRLIERWREGDRDAGLELLDHYAALERSVAFRLGVRDPQALLELHQELVLRLLEQLSTLGEKIDTSFAGWLAWQIRDLSRNRGRRRELESLPTRQAGSDPDGSESTATWDAIACCKDRLPERERAVFELRYLEGLSLREVADHLSSNANAVAQSIFRLVRRMRACLAEQGFELRSLDA